MNGPVGPLTGDGTKTSYMGAEHWEAILNKVESPLLSDERFNAVTC